MSTIYRIASRDEDYAACRALMTAAGERLDPLTWPTLMAVRDGHLVAMLGTEADVRAVVCGPLVIDPSLTHPAFVVNRLWTMYDDLMRHVGVRVFIFCSRETNTAWLRWLTRKGLTPWQTTDDLHWYWREVPAA